MTNFYKFAEKKMLILLATVVIVKNFTTIFYNIFNRHFVPGEFQHTHIAWNMSQGLKLYKDFFEHHGPIYSYINSFILGNLENPVSFNTFFQLREISFLYSISIALCIFYASYLVSRKNLCISLLSVAIFSTWSLTQRSLIEIRPDVIQCFFMTLGFVFLTKAIFNKSKISIIISGILFGLMTLSNFKAIAIIAGLSIAFILNIFLSQTKEPKLEFFNFTLGFVGVWLISIVFFSFNNNLHYFIDSNILFNFTYIIQRGVPESALKLLKINFLEKDLPLTILFFTSILIIDFKKKEYRFLALSLPFTLIGLFKGLYPHYCLIFFPQISILMASAIQRISTKLVQRKFLFTGLIISILLLSRNHIKQKFFIPPSPQTNKLSRQRSNLEWVINNLERNEKILANSLNCPAYVFNKDFNFEWNLKRFTQLENLQGLSGFGINSIPKNEIQKNHLLESFNKKGYEAFKINNKYSCFIRKIRGR